MIFLFLLIIWEGVVFNNNKLGNYLLHMVGKSDKRFRQLKQVVGHGGLHFAVQFKSF